MVAIVRSAALVILCNKALVSTQCGICSRTEKQKLAKRMSNTSGGGNSAVYLYLEETNHTFNNTDVVILDRAEVVRERGERSGLRQV